jgi:cephalosporin-C deacetylase-like acetyl esterase
MFAKTVCVWFGLAAVVCGAEYAVRGTTDKAAAVYQSGEKITFTLRVLDGETPVGGMTLKWTRTGDDGKTETGEGVAGPDGLAVATASGRPGFVRLQAHAFGPDGKNLQGFVGGWGGNKNGNIFFDGGACVEPEKLRAGAEPPDFDAFWDAVRAKEAAEPLAVERNPVEGGKPGVFAVTLACPGPKPVTGYLSVPPGAAPKSLPAIVSFHGYGINKHTPPGWVNPSVIEFNINAHGMELGRGDDYYEQLKKDLDGYAFKNGENADREKAYFYGMALRVLRALHYVKTLPEWNGKELQSNGGSQGGLQGLWGAGLDKDVTSSAIWSPWCCDLGGIQQGRLRGWRPDYTPALDYYDPVFHAKRIAAKVHLVANLGDYTCPPSGVWVVYNAVPGAAKSMEVKQGCTHGYEMKGGARFTVTPEGIVPAANGNAAKK